MPYSAPTVTHGGLAVSGVISVVINRGRQYFSDPFQATSCTIEIVPSTTAPPSFVIGDLITVTISSGGTAKSFHGWVVEIQRSYGYIFNPTNGVAPADRIVVTAQGPTGTLGSQSYTEEEFWAPSDVVTSIDDLLVDIFGYECDVTAVQGTNWDRSAGSATVTDSLLQITDETIRTGLVYVNDDIGSTDAVRALSFNPVSTATPTVGFSDTLVPADGFTYDQIEYQTSSRSTFTQVTVESRYPGMAPQTATTGNPPFNAVQLMTYSNLQSEMLELAGYVLNLFNQTTPAPFMVSATSLSANNANLYLLTKFQDYPLGSVFTIKFRGSTVQATLEGYTVQFYPDYLRYTAYFSPSVGVPFTLDSSLYGVLDTNRLGF